MAGFRELAERMPEIYLKDESAQPIGSFKLRGAYNKIAQLSAEELGRGVITYSSGNHAQGVAYAARALGIDASGPHPPDTVFMRARHTPQHPGEFDLVVAMTHDHGLIPVKYLGVAHGVNVTLGLPFVRTSPDHGTAFDIAGRGVADPSSLLAALTMARRLAALR